MKGIYLVAVLFVATLAAFTLGQSLEEEDDFKIPKECPKVDPMNTTVHLAHESDCTKFYMCLRGEKIEMKCPWMDKNHTKRLHFNPELQVCDWPNHAGCKNNPSTPSDSNDIITSYITPSSTSEVSIGTSTITPETTMTPKTTPPPPVYPDDCPKNTGGKTIAIRHPYICNYYFLCIDGKKDLFVCPQGTAFDPKIPACNWEQKVNCRGNPIIPASGPVLRECPPKGSYKTMKLPHECQCDRYYQCHDGDMILKICPKDLQYDWIREVCDIPSIVKCNRPISKNTETRVDATTSKPGCIGDCPWEDPSNYTVLLPDMDCHKFCSCSNGIAYEQDCPANLRFDYIRKVCDYPQKVHCKVTAKPAFKTDGGNEYQNMGKKNDWLNYVKEDNNDDAEETQENS